MSQLVSTGPALEAWWQAGLTSESESDELELEELEESLELSEAIPVDSWRSTESARTASSGCSCFKILGDRKRRSQGRDRQGQPQASSRAAAETWLRGTGARQGTVGSKAVAWRGRSPQAGSRSPTLRLVRKEPELHKLACHRARAGRTATWRPRSLSFSLWEKSLFLIFPAPFLADCCEPSFPRNST